MRLGLPAATAALLLSACGGGDPSLNQTGAQPQLPERDETLLPPMKIARPTGWEGASPTVPQGFVITPMASDLKIPRQILVLPNGDILVAEGSGGAAPKLRPKDVIAGYIKSLGKTKVKGGDRITLLRDADGDGRAELQTTFIKNLDAPYGMAFVDGALYVANQDALLRFVYTEGQTQITAPAEELTRLPSQINHHWTKSLTASADGPPALCRHRLQQQCRRTWHGRRGGEGGRLGGRSGDRGSADARHRHPQPDRPGDRTA